MPYDMEQVTRLAAADHGLAIVATTRTDGSVHASLVNAGVLADPVSGTPSVGTVIRGDAIKLKHLRRTGRASITFRSGWDWVSVEGPVRIIGPDDLAEEFPAEGLPALLREVFTAAGGTHDNWAEYDRVMAEERRTAVFVHPDRILSNAS